VRSLRRQRMPQLGITVTGILVLAISGWPGLWDSDSKAQVLLFIAGLGSS
jgi:hypothetical protein